MKKGYLIFMCLALASLACLQPVARDGIEQAFMVTEQVTATPARTLSPSPSPLPSPGWRGDRCARVVAIEALHVRIDANERAVVLTWLRNGDVVKVIDQVNADWWRIEREGVSGYARSKYLEIGDCEANDEH